MISPGPSGIYVNRNLKLDQVQMVGFDMDYTLALYHQDKMEELSVLATLHKLVVNKGYPEQIRQLKYDPTLAIRGLMVDQQLGNVFKPDRYGTPGRALHGSARCPGPTWPRSTTSTGCAWATPATPGSTPCSRCPKRCCT